MKKVLSIISIIITALLLVSCGSNKTEAVSGKKQTTIKFACNAGYVAEFEERVIEFNKIHPEIKVEIIGIAASSWGEMLNAISLDIIAGNGPDIADIASEGMYVFAESGLLQPIDDYLERDKEELSVSINGMSSKLKEAHKINGKYYSLPTVWNNMCIYYNKTVLKNAGLEEPKAGWTTEEFLEYCKNVVKNNKGDKNDVYGYAFFQNYFTTLEPWLQAFNTSILNDDWSESLVNTDEAKQAFQFLYDLVKTYKVSPAMGTDDSSLFVQNKLAFMGCGLWYVEKLKNMGFSSENYDVVPFPSVDGEIHSVIGVGGAPIFKASKNKDAAWEFAKFLSSYDFQKEFLSDNIWAIPSIEDAAKAVFAKPFFPKNSSVFWNASINGKYVPAPAKYTSVESNILREFGAIMAGVKTIDQATQAAKTAIDGVLNE